MMMINVVQKENSILINYLLIESYLSTAHYCLSLIVGHLNLTCETMLGVNNVVSLITGYNVCLIIIGHRVYK